MARIERAVLDNLMEAGMLDANGNDSILSGSLPFGQLSIPQHIYLIGDSLYYRSDVDYSPKRVDDANALNAFVRIRIKTPDDILRFAGRYGPLGLCKHGLPPMHRGSWYRDEYKDGELVGVTYTAEWNPARGGSERGWCPPQSPEPIERWFYYVVLALSCLDFKAQMTNDPGKIRVPAKYLKRIASNPPKIADSQEEPVIGLGKLFVTDRINEWLGDAGIRLELNWSSNEPSLILTGGGVFGALGVQLLTAVTANIALCSGCQTPYLREAKRPKPGQRNFCDTCVTKGVPNKLRQRDWQNKQKGG